MENGLGKFICNYCAFECDVFKQMEAFHKNECLSFVNSSLRPPEETLEIPEQFEIKDVRKEN